MQLFADYHVHTDYSDDSVYPMTDVVRDAERTRVYLFLHL